MAANSWQPKNPEVARVLDRLRDATAAITGRIDALEREAEARWAVVAENRTELRTRKWQVTLAVVTGLVLPLAVLGILAVIHLVAR